MKTSIVVFLLFSLVFGVGAAWADGGGANCSIPPFVRQGAPPNVLLDISVETPMQGAADPDIACTGDPTTDTYECPKAACNNWDDDAGRYVSNCYDDAKSYYGYFDSSAQYSYNSTDKYFYKDSSGDWSGNFLNWSTMTAIDAVRKAFTGGNRDVDTADTTILLRANQALSYSSSWFPVKATDNGGSYTPHSGTIYIINKGKGFAVCSDSDPNVSLDGDGFPTGASEDELGVYNARIKVCDPSAGLESNCRPYGGNYKPVGVMQRYADTMRFGLITYALGPPENNPSNRASSNGGVIRANMKWICPKIPRGLKYHDGASLLTCDTPGGCTNPEAEINADGTFVHDPEGVGGGNNSGVINYLNWFGYQQGYKSHDPISEMYYEAIRYFKNLGPTALYTQFDDGTSIPAIDDGFPVYANRSGLNWRDPMIYRCQQNFIVALNDAYPWLDKRLPGTFFVEEIEVDGEMVGKYNADIPDEKDEYFHPDGYVDHGEPTDADPDINVRTLTNLVGAMEGINGTTKECIGCDPYYDEGEDPRCSDLECEDKVITNLGDVHGTCWGATRRNSYYIAGLAYYAHTNDLRDDLDGMQNITTYVIDSQEANPRMLVGQMNMLYLAAKYGGFNDRNNNNQPDERTEWDKDSSGDPGYGFPDTYFFASDPSKVEGALEQTFGEILQRTSSGTAVSVLSTSAEGEGSLFQAFFNPAVYEGSRKISWVGYLNAMWVDQYGNLRENTVVDPNPALVLDEDYVIEFDLSATGETVVHRYHDADGDGLVDIGTDFVDTIDLSELKPVYDYGKILAEDTAEGDRTIYTFRDKYETGQPAPPPYDVEEWLEFTTDNADELYEYLNAADEAEAEFIINYIRGAPLSVTGTTCRNREIAGDIWKLGDIVNSTPSVVGKPMGQYHLIYGDPTYLPFIRNYKNRETIIYVGANDGMLHAFSAGTYHEGDNPATDLPQVERGWYEGADRGKEKWAYVPYNLLPHLKWLTDPDYCHVYYVDLKTRVVDARIFDDDADHPNGWGTVIIGAMRLGGPAIVGGPISDQRTFCSAYFALDITNPEKDPKLLWEFNDTTTPAFKLGYTVSYPTTIRRGPKDEAGTWYAIFGSGPSTFDGSGATTGHVYIRDLRTGTLEKEFDINISNNPLFMATPITVDKGLDYDVDVAYIGATYDDSGTWKGKMYRIDLDHESSGDWILSTFFSAEKPITSAPTAALDPFNRLWIFWGSGRYFSDADKTDNTSQRLYGVWDPGTGTLNKDNLNNVTPIRVHEDGYVDFNGDGTYSGGDDKPFTQYLTDVRDQYNTPSKYGWYLDMPATGERSLAKSTLLGDIVLFPTFDPNNDLCDYGGDSYLYALYYETGTAYKESVIGLGSNTIDVGGPKKEVLKKKYLGLGMPTSVVIHAGQQQGVTGMIQLGTGVVEEVDITPATSPRSKVLFWREKTD
jgi:Tfp pilus tip-associated adhesin PilY1